MNNCFENKSILIIGGTGTIGRELVRKLLGYNVKVVRVYSRDEYKQFLLSEESKEENVRFLIGDVRDRERLKRAMSGIDIVFNLAALKHVPSSEYNPFEAVKTNVIGVQNVIECAIDNNVETVIYTSSDKAISPTNTMGATKLLAERIMTAADYSKGVSKARFASVRFGNVIGSRGSVIPLFFDQIEKHGYLTITHPEMTRFMMTIDNAVDLILEAAMVTIGGEVFILKMPVLKIGDLAEACIKHICKKKSLTESSIERRIIGLRPGEKMYEELMTVEESRQAYEMSDMYVIAPYHGDDKVYAKKYKNKAQVKEYSSQKIGLMGMDDIGKILEEMD